MTSTGIEVTQTYDNIAVWGDYDNDGSLDIYVYNNGDKSAVYRGHGDGTFTKIITEISGDFSEALNATWSDYDLDGDLDLSMSGSRYIYRYDGNDTFSRVDISSSINYGADVMSWGDYDDDGDPDVYVGSSYKDEFYDNNGDGTFTLVTDQRITVDYNYSCCSIRTPTALWTDFNNDRKLDLTVVHASAPFFVYSNRENNFDSVFYFYEHNTQFSRNVYWTDYDADGDLDLFSMGQYNLKTRIWETRHGQLFKPLAGGPLYDYVSSDAIFAWNDYDNDGYSDLFQFDGNRFVYKNISNGNNWIKIRLKGRVSNSTGLGAKVFVKAKGQWQRSDITTHHSFQVQQGFMSLFGIGNATAVDSVKILWPSGYRQYLTAVDVNQVVVLDENDAQVKVLQGPSNLHAEVRFPSGVKLDWTDRSNGGTGFVIEMAAGDGEFAEVASVGMTVTSTIVDGLSVGIKYKFRVRPAGSLNSRASNVEEAQIRMFSEVFAGDLTAFQSKPEGAAWGDPDNDGDPDLFVGSRSFTPDIIYYNENGKFSGRSLRTGNNYSRQAQWIDFNNDGYQDLHVSVGGGIGAIPETLNDFLYLNDGTGQLVAVTGSPLVTDGSPDYTAAWGDLNDDGFLDMVRTGSSNNQSPVFLNLGGSFVRQTGSNGNVRTSDLLVLSDIDNDRDLDLVSSGIWSYSQGTVFENRNGEFTELFNSGLDYASAFVLEDFDNDGDLDVLMTYGDNTLRLYLYDPATRRFAMKPNTFPQFGAARKLSAGDFDNNGFIDVIVAGDVTFNGNSNRIFLNEGNLKFKSLPDPILEQRINGTAIADFNKDGQLDIFVTTDNGFDGMRYLLRTNAGSNHWLRVKLKGIGSNRFGIGGRIRLFTANTSQVREIRSGSGGTFSDEQIAHFGLGSTTTVDYLKIEWANGDDQWIAVPPIDVEITVEQAVTPGPAAPASPSNLVATAKTSRHVDLAWTDNSNNEMSFRLERSIGSGSFTLFKILPPNTSTYTDSSFAGSSSHLEVKYRIRAGYYETVASGPSNEASVVLSVVVPVLGFEDEANELSIYPQPASSKVFIRSEKLLLSVTLIGPRGETIKEITTIGLQETEITFGDAAPGMYVLKVTTDAGPQVRKLLVIGEN